MDVVIRDWHTHDCNGKCNGSCYLKYFEFTNQNISPFRLQEEERGNRFLNVYSTSLVDEPTIIPVFMLYHNGYYDVICPKCSHKHYSHEWYNLVTHCHRCFVKFSRNYNKTVFTLCIYCVHYVENIFWEMHVEQCNQ